MQLYKLIFAGYFNIEDYGKTTSCCAQAMKTNHQESQCIGKSEKLVQYTLMINTQIIFNRLLNGFQTKKKIQKENFCLFLLFQSPTSEI